MNRTIKEATVKRFHYDDHAQLRVRHATRTNGAPCLTLADFMDAYNFGRRLKTLKGLTPYEFICKCWTSERLCCTNPMRDSSCESSVVAGGHEQTHTPRLQDQELARLQ